MKELAKKEISRRIRKTILKKLWLWFGPIIGIVLVTSLVIFTVLGVTYGFMANAGGDTNCDGVFDETDQLAIEEYSRLIDKTNVSDTWLTQNITADGKVKNIGSLIDRDEKDFELINNWATIHSYIVFWMYTSGAENFPQDLPERTSKDLHPTFKYRESLRTVCVTETDKDGNSETTCIDTIETLLTEADTIYGHYKYNYEYVTVTHGNTTTTYEKYIGRELLAPQWERLETYLTDTYGIDRDDGKSIRVAFVNSVESFYNKQINLAWLMGSSTDLKNLQELGDCPNGIPVYIQGNYRHTYFKPGSTVAESGCGVTAAAMVASAYTGKKVTPDIIADESYRLSTAVFPDAWKADYIFDRLSQYGISNTVSWDIAAVETALLNKDLVIAQTRGPGAFNKGENHYIVLTAASHGFHIVLLKPMLKNTLFFPGKGEASLLFAGRCKKSGRN